MISIKNFLLGTFMGVLLLSSTNYSQNKTSIHFPLVKKESKPWTYWWWMGSAVDKENLSYSLQKFAEAGIGGVHIIPVYGVKGFEEKFIDYLSPKWMEMLSYTTAECKRLGLGTDMTLGTGWPFGGSQVKGEYSSARLNDISIEATGGSEISINLIEKAKQKRTQTYERKILDVNAYPASGERVNLFQNVDASGLLKWHFPSGNWKIIALVLESPVQQVKRAAPGAAGNVVDPFSLNALNDYLSYFEKAFKSYKGKMVRSFYHDSYEYQPADWTRDFLDEFQKRRGYNLLDMLPAFTGEGDIEIISRVKSDYRFTIAQLNEEFIKRTRNWSNQNGVLFRNQAHGSPTNLLDTYAAADIPECEVFGTPALDIPGLGRDTVFMNQEFVDPLILKFASSAGHVAGRSLISSETGTWLAEHFRESLSQIKPEIDLLLLSGINHIFFHGIAYSPKEEEWPGWQFYASTSFAPTNSIWHDFPSLNKYIARCQSVLQTGKPDNEILIYFPIWDVWHSPKGRTIDCKVHNPKDWLFGSKFYELSKKLMDNGYSFDYISDEQIKKGKLLNGEIHTGSNTYKTIIIPSCRFIPVETYKKLLGFIQQGGMVIFQDQLPKDVPGYLNYESRRLELNKISSQIIQLSLAKKRNTLIGGDIISMLSNAGLNRESISDSKVNFIRRKTGDGRFYFLANQQSKPLNDWVELAYPAESLIILDPMDGKSGLAKIRKDADGTTSVYLQLEPGSSLILKTVDKKIARKNWIYLKQTDRSFEIKGEWNVQFTEGGPLLPAPVRINKLESWTNFGDTETKRFAGTARYKIKFQNPDSTTNNWILDLGKVCESARVKINQHDLGTLWSLPFRKSIGDILVKGENELEIEVTNLSANRIRDLDIRGVNWKKFYDINFVNIHYKKFDASRWDLVDSGLLGPVKLYPVEEIN